MAIDKIKYPLNYRQAMIVMESGGMVAGTIEDLTGFELTLRLNAGTLQVFAAIGQKWIAVKGEGRDIKGASYRMTDKTPTEEESRVMAVNAVKAKTGIDFDALDDLMRKAVGVEKYEAMKALAEKELELPKAFGEEVRCDGGLEAPTGTTLTTVLSDWDLKNCGAIFKPFFGKKTKITLELVD